MTSKVAIIKCDSYDLQTVKSGILRGLDLIGGLHTLIPQNDKILLKPNLLNKAAPEKAVTTHPAVFEAVIQILKDNSYNNIRYGDSPGNPAPPERVAETCGLFEVGEKYSLPFSDFSNGKTVNFPEGKFAKQFEISNGALEADSIINLCKMKTHGLMRITGGVKNLLGCVYGFNKGMSHAKFPSPDTFGKMLVDLSLCLKPKLHIMDGIIAMEGNGPFSGTPVPMNVLLLSTDPVALDAVFCKLINLDPLLVPTIKYGEEYGLGKWLDKDLELFGDDIEPLINKNFDVFKGSIETGKWNFLSNLRRPLIRKPVINREKCIKCGACVNACPIKDPNGENDLLYQKKIALYFPEKTHVNTSTSQSTAQNPSTRSVAPSLPPKFNYKNCIRCFCCQEMCPAKAIEVKTPMLGRLFIYKSK